MKKDVRERESFIFAIYNKRHDVNEILLAVPLIFVIFFLMIGVPIIMVLCELPLVWLPVLIFGPILCVTAFYFIRKKIIMNGFVKIRDISDRVELISVQSDEFENSASGKVFMFGYSEYMEVVLYNWFLSLNVIGNGKLRIYKVFYDNCASTYLAVREDELNIPEASREEYEKETRMCLLLSDMENGKVVNVKLYARLISSKVARSGVARSGVDPSGRG